MPRYPYRHARNRARMTPQMMRQNPNVMENVLEAVDVWYDYAPAVGDPGVFIRFNDQALIDLILTGGPLCWNAGGTVITQDAITNEGTNVIRFHTSDVVDVGGVIFWPYFHQDIDPSYTPPPTHLLCSVMRVENAPP